MADICTRLLDSARVTGYSEVKVSCGLVPRNALVLTGLANFRMVGNPEVIVGLGPRHPGRVLTFRKLRLPQSFFLTFSLLDVPYIYEGSSRRMFPWELGGPDSAR